ncbi:RidA family protein [uncultured Sphaerochaeta sp.]|uniref:RidA family protein n=1 Tax=uncultured Sphaerochaeta sp. TaxID=886478 RepID=UPI002A0A156D|nr:RidA family protein [uncultured Sphaerochaeta sp.]
MNIIEEKLKGMGMSLPSIPPAAGNFIPSIRSNNLVFCSGQGPYINGKNLYLGKVGENVTEEQAYEAAKIACLNCLAEVKQTIGDLDKITQIISVRGFVNGASTFTEHPKVINGVSDLLVALFGEKGKHVRCAIGTSLPGNIPVEVEMIVEVEA